MYEYFKYFFLFTNKGTYSKPYLNLIKKQITVFLQIATNKAAIEIAKFSDFFIHTIRIWVPLFINKKNTLFFQFIHSSLSVLFK